MTLPIRWRERDVDADLCAAALASIRRHLVFALALGGALVVGVGGWAGTTMISGAIVSGGQLVAASEVKKIQHPTGGIIAALPVHEGAHVRAGDLLIRLDDTQVRTSLDTVLKALDELSGRRARNEAEQDASDGVHFPQDLIERRADPTVAHLIDSETRLFGMRVASRRGQKDQLRAQIGQTQDEIKGLADQADAKQRETDVLTRELGGVRELLAKHIVPISRVTPLERDLSRLEGERGQVLAAAAAAKGKISQIELQILQIDEDMRTETGKELAEIRSRWSELVEKRVALEDQLTRLDIRSPQDGIVQQMTVHTIGGLVTPSEPPMLIVPEADELVVEVKIQPQDINNVWLDQKADLRFLAFNGRLTPELSGHISRISADVVQDKTGAMFYPARIRISEDEIRRLGGPLVPGMPVEAFMQLGYRSVLSYLVQPLSDQIAKAWRER